MAIASRSTEHRSAGDQYRDPWSWDAVAWGTSLDHDDPNAGGGHPLPTASGRNRWSIHPMNHANRVRPQTYRGEPVVEAGPNDAEARGVNDDDLVRVCNDIAPFVCRAKVAPGVPRHIQDMVTEWQPIPTDRGVPCEFEKA